MKTRIVFLLIIVVWGRGAYATDDGLLNITSSAALCEYGSYHLNGKCVAYDSETAQDGCDTNYYMTVADQASFMALFPYTPVCLGTYTEYDYNSTLSPLFVGTLLSTGGAALCEYGSYHLNGECIEYTSETAQSFCDADSYMTVADQASFMALFPYTPVCLGTYTQYNYEQETFDGIYPLFIGTLLSTGSAIGDYGVFQKMFNSNCDVNGENYYSIELVGVAANDQPFLHPQYGMCDTLNNYSKFIVKNDCKDIDVADVSQLSENQICGVLCENAGDVYTNSGICATGYCMNGSKKMRLHVARPDGEKYDYPLYASKTSTPALNFKFLDKDTNEERMCYVNLVPPDAINHFVTTKPNPIRVGKTFTWFDSAGKEHTAPNLITID